MARPSIGWTLLSREALRRAEAQLRDETQGVRDEIGFLSLHQAYSDRFFPGTSVLQTRLRYILFIPWIYQGIIAQNESRQVESILQKREIELAGRLRLSNEDGIIGTRTYPKPAAQPPSMVYWTALTTWGIVRPHRSGFAPSRASFHRGLRSFKPLSRLPDDDDQPLEEQTPFISIPTPPKDWYETNKPLSFQFCKSEACFIRRQIMSVPRPNTVNTPSLLAKMVEQKVKVEKAGYPWDPSILNVADQDDEGALLRAQQVAALSAIGRGVYAALVERIRQEKDGLQTENIHGSNLPDVVKAHVVSARALDIKAVIDDVPYLPQLIITVLRDTQDWLKSPKNAFDLLPIYEQAERMRKGCRARLPQTPSGRQRRSEWCSKDHPLASPIHFRWTNVRRLLNDLENG